MKEALSEHKPLNLTPERIFADTTDCRSFAYNYLGRLLAGLSSGQDALSRLHKTAKTDGITSNFIAHEEQIQEEKWQTVSGMLSLVFRIPVATIDREDLLSQFNVLSQQRVKELSAIGNRQYG